MSRRGDQQDDEEQQRRLTDRAVVVPDWPTVDGQHGLSPEESVGYARNFFLWGFALLPLLWAVNCLYFWPILRSRASDLSPSSSHARLRPYVVRSAIGFIIFTVLLSTWALTFMIGGEHLFGPVWQDLVMYNLANKLGMDELF